MKNWIAAVIGLFVIGVSAAAWASCPPGTRYQCYNYGGKVTCSCS